MYNLTPCRILEKNGRALLTYAVVDVVERDNEIDENNIGSFVESSRVIGVFDECGKMINNRDRGMLELRVGSNGLRRCIEILAEKIKHENEYINQKLKLGNIAYKPELEIESETETESIENDELNIEYADTRLTPVLLRLRDVPEDSGKIIFNNSLLDWVAEDSSSCIIAGYIVDAGKKNNLRERIVVNVFDSFGNDISEVDTIIEEVLIPPWGRENSAGNTISNKMDSLKNVWCCI